VSDAPVPSPETPDATLVARRDADLALEYAKALLAAPVFQKQLPLAFLTAMAHGEHAHPREKLRAAEALLAAQLKAIEIVANVTGAREQRLKDLGIAAPPQEVNLTQVNQRIEIVREGARDWRTAEGG